MCTQLDGLRFPPWSWGRTVWGEYIRDRLLTVGCLLVVVLLVFWRDVFFCMSMLLSNNFILWHASPLNNTLHWNLSVISEGKVGKNDIRWNMSVLENIKGVYFLSSLYSSGFLTSGRCTSACTCTFAYICVCVCVRARACACVCVRARARARSRARARVRVRVSERDGNLPQRTCPECSVPEPHWALVPAKPA